MQSRLPYKRAERVGDLLREILSELLMNKIHHLGLEGLTLTSVKISDDLQHARVFYRLIDPGRRVEIAKKLPKVAGLLRKEAGHELKLKRTPELRFEYDESLEYGDKIERLLASIKKRDSEEE